MSETQTVRSNRDLFLLTPAALALSWLVSKAQWFWNHRPDLQFGWIVLMLVAFLLWDGWDRRPAIRARVTPLSCIFALFGFFLLFVVQIYQAAFGLMPASLLGLSIGVLFLIGSNLLYVFGWAGVRHFGFAFAFILIALPMPTFIYNPVVSGLQHRIASLNVFILNLAGIAARQSGSLIQLPSGTIGIDEACSGIRSLQSTIMATLFIGYLSLKRRSLQVLLLGLGVGLALFGNIIRSLFLTCTANNRGIKAVEGVHDAAGWSILLFTGLGVVALSYFLAQLEKRADALEREAAQKQVGSPEKLVSPRAGT
jgi:exosortase